MLECLSIQTEIIEEEIGCVSFLTFECRPLSPEELSWLAGHSCVTLIAEKKGELLRPLPVRSPDALPEDLPEILKYKGKTNPTFTRMMLNVALSLTPSARTADQVVVLDPLCGRGTTLFCSLCMGACAVGIDKDHRDLQEAADYFSRYLKSAGIKHSVRSFSSTVASKGIPGKCFTFGLSREAYRAGVTHSLILYEADASLAGKLLRKQRAHLLVADLPYGVQHAPESADRPDSFRGFLERVLPSWRQALQPGASVALSFNSLTLKAGQVRDALAASGFQTFDAPAFTGLSHPVEQAVVRDLVFARLP